MIVRINQIDVAAAEPACGWEAGTLRGALEFTWPLRTFAYQILILDHDERNQPLSVSFRQHQIRQLIPQVLAALTANELDRAVVRLDGPLVDDGLLPVFRFLGDATLCERYAVSAAEKLDPLAEPALCSIRMLPSASLLTTICSDAQISLEQSVRLRGFAVPDSMVNPLLDTADVDDERWRDILPRATMMLSTAIELASLLVWTPRFDPAEAKRRIMQRLRPVSH